MTCWGDKAVPEQVMTFEISFIGRQWLQKLSLTNGQQYIQSGDGENVYFLLVDTAAKTQGKIKSYPGNVFRGDYPVQSPATWTILPWLAYCSGKAIADRTTNSIVTMPAPWAAAWAQPMAHIYKAKYTGLAQGGGLPQRLEFQPDAERMEAIRKGVFNTIAVINDSGRDRAVMDLRYYSKINELEGIYEVTATTNCGALAVPAAFLFERYLINPSKQKRSIFEKIEGKIDLVESIEIIDSFPNSPDKTEISVADYRIGEPERGFGFVSYQTKNSKWLAESDPYLQQRRLQAINGPFMAFNGAKIGRAFMLVVFFSILITPLAASKRCRDWVKGFQKRKS